MRQLSPRLRLSFTEVRTVSAIPAFQKREGHRLSAVIQEMNLEANELAGCWWDDVRLGPTLVLRTLLKVAETQTAQFL
jgi:hypothetical protein